MHLHKKDINLSKPKAISNLRIILGDQLSEEISSLHDIDPKADLVLMSEVMQEASYVPHHKQKLVFIFSAMRHFSKKLRRNGLAMEYVTIDSPDNSGSLTGEVKRLLQKYAINKIIVTEPGEWRILKMIEEWSEIFETEIEIRDDNRFLCSREQFKQWANSYKQLRMENFYRYMRKQTGWLMESGKPVGGKFNYDASNRKAIPKGYPVPQRKTIPLDDITKAVLECVDQLFIDNPGVSEPFNWAVTREGSLDALNHFIEYLLENFGQFQDSMKTDEDFLFHSLLSPYINIGLLNPKEVCERVLEARKKSAAPIESVEGFIRQILGWREYVRGIYWLKMPEYAQTNTFEANRPLPNFFWTGNTKLFCLHQSIKSTLNNAYAHHIQRLMIIGNFSLLTALSPKAVEQWYLAVYADAFEWVELPNTHGMVLYADEGLLASKPYAASGAYINKMSDYCQHCEYNVKEKNGKTACPFNYLYWYFLLKNKYRLDNNQRLRMPYRTLAKMTGEKTNMIQQDAETFLNSLK